MKRAGHRVLRVLASPWARSLLYVVTAAIVFGVWLSPVRIHGISMQPTIFNGQYALVDRLAYRGEKEPARGDIVWIRGAEEPEPLYYIKRIIGLPGEALEMRAGRLFADGDPIPEPYTPANPYWWFRIRIPEGYFYFVGDNRTMPFADHYQGLVPRELVLGRVRWWRHLADPAKRD